MWCVPNRCAIAWFIASGCATSPKAIDFSASCRLKQHNFKAKTEEKTKKGGPLETREASETAANREKDFEAFAA